MRAWWVELAHHTLGHPHTHIYMQAKDCKVTYTNNVHSTASEQTVKTPNCVDKKKPNIDTTSQAH